MKPSTRGDWSFLREQNERISIGIWRSNTPLQWKGKYQSQMLPPQQWMSHPPHLPHRQREKHRKRRNRPPEKEPLQTTYAEVIRKSSSDISIYLFYVQITTKKMEGKYSPIFHFLKFHFFGATLPLPLSLTHTRILRRRNHRPPPHDHRTHLTNMNPAQMLALKSRAKSSTKYREWSRSTTSTL